MKRADRPVSQTWLTASFWPHVVHVGPGTLALDACGQCHELVTSAEAAA